MISIDNLYWVLFDNLLRPHDIDCWYYYPWGTKTNLSKQGEFQKFYRTHHANHVLFHFDQEPIWENDLGYVYEREHFVWSNKLVRILANSEHSDFKNGLIKSRSMLDWYFFYHGFAALDWYRDTRFVINQTEIDNVFLSFNHIVSGRRAYRLDLLSRIVESGIHEKGNISLHARRETALTELQDTHSSLSDSAKHRIENCLIPLMHREWKLDEISINGDMSARCGHHEYRLWQRSFLHLVNETVFYEKKLHLTEKIFKPIVACRPFLLVGAAGNLDYLKSYGFKTFGDYLDESYDSIQDNDERLCCIATELDRLSRMPIKALRDLYVKIKPVCEFNKQHFFTDFRQRIIDELVDNFERCLLVWNNGRMDGKNLDIKCDFDAVKKLLSR